MAVKEFGPLFQFASWNIPQIPRAIEYPLEVMEEIRAFACDELLQLSHGGHEVGGILFGTRRDDLVRILTWRPIACEHGRGEALLLSYNDRINLAVQLELARQTADLKDLLPLGCFVSHLRDGVCLSAADLEIYNGFFPEPWQVALVVHPHGGGSAEAGFFMREGREGSEGKDKLRTESSYHSFELRPLEARQETVSAASAPRGQESTGKSDVKSETRPDSPPQPRGAPAPEHTGVWPGIAVAAPEREEVPLPPAPFRRAEQIRPLSREMPSPQLPLPSFETEESLPTKERWLWAIPILLALGIAAFVLYQRGTPSPSSSIALRAWNEAETVQLAWDANSRAVRDSYRGEMQINDGGRTSQVALTNDQLHAGKMSYLPQSSDIGFEITIYPANGDPIHDSTRLIAPALHQPTQGPQLVEDAPAAPSAVQSPAPVAASPPPAPVPEPAAPDANARDRELQQLRQEVAKQRARADELQNLVRILENRLSIQPTLPKPQQSH
jgi:hypothetical protein